MYEELGRACVLCSVPLAEDRRDDRSADRSRLLCGNCRQFEQAMANGMDPDELAPPSAVPAGCQDTVQLVVLSLVRECWNCRFDTTCFVGLYPRYPAEGYCGAFATDDEETMALVVRLLQRSGRGDIARSVGSRYSYTAGVRSLANGCQSCGALQGNFPVHEEASARVADGGLGGLDEFVVVDCPVLEWQMIVHRGASAMGI